MNKTMTKKTITLIAFTLLLSLVLVACGNRETPEQAVTNAFNALKNSDMETAQKYFSDSDLLINDSESDGLFNDEEEYKLLLNNFSFNIISSSEDGDTATVQAEITNIDMASVLLEYFDQIFTVAYENALAGDQAKSDEEMDAIAEQLFYDLLTSEDNEKVTSTIDINLTRQDNSWKIESDDELNDAVLGGLFSALEDLMNGLSASE